MSAGPDFRAAVAAAERTLAAELGCPPEALRAPGVAVFERPDPAGVALRRRYPPCEPCVAGAGFGAGAVLAASPGVLERVRELCAGATRDQVFDAPLLAAFAALVEPAGLTGFGPIPRLLCGSDTLVERPPPPGVELRLERDPPPERADALGRARWPNAFASGPRPERPERALALALEGGAPVGAAAMAADSELLWQIGVDVAPEARGRGVGAALVSALAGEALARGALPFYGAAPANVASLRTAAAAGFRLAWLEFGTRAPPQEAVPGIR